MAEQPADLRHRQRLIQEHLDAIERLQAEAAREGQGAGAGAWPPRGYYMLWHLVVGMVHGLIGAAVSLLANVIGAPLFGQPPLQLIRVYLTFPMGQRALDAEQGVLLTVGCTLYLVTGALYGIAFHLVMSAFFKESPRVTRLIVATGIGLALWLVNFYGILSWLQPLLLGGNWIVTLVPPWVAAATHLAFAWTMLAVSFWGRFEQ